MKTLVKLAKDFKWFYLGFAFFLASLEIFRRVATSFTLEISRFSSPALLMVFLLCGCLITCLSLLIAAHLNRSLSTKIKALVCSVLTLVLGLAFLFALLLPDNSVAAWLTFFAYFLLGVVFVLTFSGWIQALSLHATMSVIVYVITCCVIGRVLGCIVIPLENPLMSGILVLLFTLLGALLLFPASPKDLPSHESDSIENSQAAIDDQSVFSVKHRMKMLLFPLIGVSLVFFDSGIKALPIHEDALTVHHPEIALVGSILMFGIILMAFLFATADSKSKIDLKKVAPLLPVCAMFLACFAFVRMFSGGDPLKNIVSMIGTASIGGFISIFITYIAVETEKATQAQRETCIMTSFLVFIISFALGMTAFALFGDGALYVQIIFCLVYVTALAFVSMVKQSRNEEISLEERCEELTSQHGLSTRESEVLLLLASNYSVTSIAEQLFISVGTVRAHKKRIYAKLDVHKYEELLHVVNNVEVGSE